MNHHKTGGRIELIYGAMFSGKSSELLRRLRRYTAADRKTLLIRYLADLERNDETTFTHNNQILDKNIEIKIEKDLHIDNQICDSFEVIGIDEGQFFKNIVHFSEEMANRGKIIIIAALDGTFKREEFNKILSLIPLSESVIKLNSVCQQCKNENGAFTKRIDKENQAIEVIGGKDDYIAVCRTCYFK